MGRKIQRWPGNGDGTVLRRFSAVSGSSLATAATMARVAMPPMRKYKYKDSLASGTLAAGNIGIMIPPSVPMIIYGIVTETNIGNMFIAGILPGILLTLSYLGAVYLSVLWKPELGPPGDPVSREEKLRTLYKTWPIIVLFVLVLGGIYLVCLRPRRRALSDVLEHSHLRCPEAGCGG